ncbi:MAG: sulfite exporter TauE/SafE family protein [Acidobacteria bacterium]|nr:sulfite exporter TauE/SafE family protein [Acidobacteriota bacterium]
MMIVGLILVGIVAGSVAASLGIGGGIIYVPALVTIFSLAQHEAQGTSLALIIPTTIVATIVHSRAGRVDWRISGLLAIGAVGGGFLGAQAALALEAPVLRKMFGVMVAITALRMLHQTRQAAHSTDD